MENKITYFLKKNIMIGCLFQENKKLLENILEKSTC